MSDVKKERDEQIRDLKKNNKVAGYQLAKLRQFQPTSLSKSYHCHH